MRWARRVGKRRWAQLLVDRALLEGEHVHRIDTKREWCEGGDSECPTWQRQLEAMRDEEHRRGDSTGGR
jgi:hypothetical protein